MVTAVCLSLWAGVASANGVNVAILSALGSTSYDADIVSKIQANASFLNITVINVGIGTATPTPDLTTYAAVLVTASFGNIADNVGLGNDLYTFLNNGGGVVVALSANQRDSSIVCKPNYELCGSFYSNDYWALETSTSLKGPVTSPQLGTIHDAGSPILAGVSSFVGGTQTYYLNVTVNPAATDVADWNDGVPLIATRTFAGGGREVGLNFYPPSSDVRSPYDWLSTSDGGKILANSLLWAGNVSISEAPETGTLILVGAGLSLLSLRLKRRR